MGWSAGTFTRTNGTYTGSGVWASDEAALVDIQSSRHDTHDQDLATGINSCIHKGGQNSPTADLPMGSFKHTNVANATARSNYGVVGQIQDGSYIWGGTSGGSANAHTLTLSPAITAYTAGMVVRFIAGFTNTTTTPTININSVGANTMKRDDKPALIAGDINAGQIYELVYDGTNWIVQNKIVGWQSWTPTFAGFSADPAGGVYRFQVVGRLCHVQVYQPNTGTSNSTGFTISAPLTAAASGSTYGCVPWSSVDNSVTQTTPAQAVITSGGTVFTIAKSISGAGGAWTAAGGKAVSFSMFYEI